MTRQRPARPESSTAVAVSRRRFVTGSAALAGAATVGLGACAGRDDDGHAPHPAETSTPATAPQRARTFFTPTEAATVEAATARILPGSPDDPGAREAEVVVYIDGLLAVAGGYGGPVYRSGPFVGPDDDPTAEDEGPADQVDGQDEDEVDEDDEDDELESSSIGVIDRPGGSFDRYGDQSLLTPADVYRTGLRALDQHARDRFGAPFVELSEDGQDAVLADLERDEAPAFVEEPTAQDLFELLRRHTIEGMFADPIYGGNRDKAGWRLIGWPGAQRAYTPGELSTEGTRRAPQGIEDLHPFHPGEHDRAEPELPVAGTGRGPDGRHEHGDG